MNSSTAQRKCKRKASEMSVNHDNITEHRVTKMIKAEASFRTMQTIRMTSSWKNQVWREQVAQWCYDVVDHLDASREAVYVAMNVLDRYIAETSSSAAMDKVEYEKIAITAFFLALRITNSVEIRIPEILSLSRSSIQPQDIISTGSRILECLTWSNRILTPHSFLKAFMGLRSQSLNPSTVTSWLDLAVYLVEISVCDGEFSQTAASQLAMAAIIVAMKKSGDYDENKKQCDSLVRDIFEHASIDPCSTSLRSLCVRLQNIYNQSQESPQANSPHVIEAEDDEQTDSCQTGLDNRSELDRVTSVSRPISPLQNKDW
ncbi:unnamed protein product [Cylindrotheca closterium]|uniref:Cyclin N-terminal domain-containing protein n=1 Tax=Cylindrotheca closterium TaxID=2856 RepID=A0AAD2PW09_9STRA|nr:unnamed protein product [Cylindrotheca closterium]